MAHKYVALPAKNKKVYLQSFDGTNFKNERQVLWGDWLSIDDNHDYSQVGDKHWAVIWGPKLDNPRHLYIKKEHTIEKRPLEIIFVDVGQGDGAVLITPEQKVNERIMVIDAGVGNNMMRFLNGRFKAYRGFNFEAAIITHPDSDHYTGFREIFGNKKIGFKTIYQNGLVERPVSGKFEKVGGKILDPNNDEEYIEDLAIDKSKIVEHFADDSNFGRFEFPPVMHNALNNPKIDDFKILSTDAAHSTHENNRAFLPGFAPSNGKPYYIEVLGPIMERDTNGDPRLRCMSSNYGKVKNGHSIILRLHFGNFKVLFGGDLNVPAEKYLLSHYAGLDKFPSKSSQAYTDMLKEAKNWFRAEVMKVCHHGSEKVTDEFMSVVNPACFVISSGDSEGHVHPRPDLLGRLGKFGRGKSPVLLSTELQRSTRESEDQALIDSITKSVNEITDQSELAEREKIIEDVKELGKTNVETYGAIYLKTDGDRLITAFKIEEKSSLKKWFYYEYKILANGGLKLV